MKPWATKTGKKPPIGHGWRISNNDRPGYFYDPTYAYTWRSELSGQYKIYRTEIGAQKAAVRLLSSYSVGIEKT